MKLDLRYLQILFLASFLVYGIQCLAWDISIEKISMVISISLLTQGMFCLAFKIPINAMKSAMITAIGISIILRSNFLFAYGMAGFFAVSSKYIFRVKNKHFFNPANFGIVFIILFTGVAWISPAQWGHSANLMFVVVSMALLILTNLRKIDLALSFIVFFFGIDFLCNIAYKGLGLDYLKIVTNSGSIVLFTFFLILDPSSSPNSRVARVIWVFLISCLAFYMQAFLFIKGAPLYALFMMSITVPILDYIFRKEGKFSWDSNLQRPLYTNDISL
jgi:Na+-transporting NADH:ubiquinone oxidoreductase subunit NqrB